MTSQWESLLAQKPLTETLNQHGVIPLTYHALITVTGPDAVKFLNGQCTCDVSKLTDNQWQLGAHCNVKGRMISSFVMAKLADDCIGLRVHSSIAQIALDTLQKYAVFSKVKCEISALVAVGLVGHTQMNAFDSQPKIGEFIISDGKTLLQHGENLSELWIHPNQAGFIALLANSELVTADHWYRLMAEKGIAEVQHATSDRYLPQAFNYDLVDGVNFKKGCYTGQEIIARLHYKGQSKQRIHGATLTSEEVHSLSIGQPIFNGEGAELGSIVAIADCSPQATLLICSRAYNDANESLFASQIGKYNKDTLISLTPFSLPYAIP